MLIRVLIVLLLFGTTAWSQEAPAEPATEPQPASKPKGSVAPS